MKRPKKTYPQGEQTKGPLLFEVTLEFKMRPAGWAGNDGLMFGLAFNYLRRVLPLFRFILRGDEKVEVKGIRWRRPGETWQVYKDERKPL